MKETKIWIIFFLLIFILSACSIKLVPRSVKNQIVKQREEDLMAKFAMEKIGAFEDGYIQGLAEGKKREQTQDQRNLEKFDIYLFQLEQDFRKSFNDFVREKKNEYQKIKW